MTSKEFRRRVSFWSQWYEAFYRFRDNKELSFIYKITFCELCGVKSVYYRPSPFVYPPDTVDCDVDTIFIERYSKLRFQHDLGYFKSFVSKLSFYQVDVLRSDSRFSNLLNFIQNEEK